MATPTPSSNTPSRHIAALSSPATAAPRSVPMTFSFDSPANLDGIGMGISMSGMSAFGVSGSAIGGRIDDEERRKRLEAVVATLATRPGRVSQEGMERLSKRFDLGFDVDSRKDGRKTLMLAGKGMLLDVDFLNDTVEDVRLDMSANEVANANFGPSTAKVLKDNLTPSGIPSINLTLDKFAKNLEALARMDRLSTEVNCFEAISGVYTSLRRLFEHEKKAAIALFPSETPDADLRAEREVTCKRSGRPTMHSRERVGLSLEYWMDKRQILQSKEAGDSKSIRRPASDTQMDIENKTTGQPHEAAHAKIYSLVIECESSSASLYPAMRISDSWISAEIEKPSDDPNDLFNSPLIDWLDPPPTYVPTSSEPDALNITDGSIGNKTPNIRFVAKLSPPLVLPLNTAVQVLGAVGVQIPEGSIRPTTFESLLLRPGEPDPSAAALVGDSTKEIRSYTNVLIVNPDGTEEDHVHRNSLFIAKPQFAHTLEDIPFAHPRQLISILPILRQYAQLSSLLQSTFSPTRSSATPKTSANLDLDVTLSSFFPNPHLTVVFPKYPLQPPSSPQGAISLNRDLDGLSRFGLPPPNADSDPDDDLASFLAAIPDLKPSIMTGEPGEALTEDAPFVVSLEIAQNADMHVVDENVPLVPQSSDSSRTLGRSEEGTVAADSEKGATEQQEEEAQVRMRTRMRVARALEVSGELGLWAEWVRRRL